MAAWVLCSVRWCNCTSY